MSVVTAVGNVSRPRMVGVCSAAVHASRAFPSAPGPWRLPTVRAAHQCITLLAEQQQLLGEAALAHRQLRQRIEVLDKQNQQRRARIQTEQELLSCELMTRYRKLAAESQYGRASLLEARHRGG